VWKLLPQSSLPYAHRVALIGFGADSGIALASAFIVFLRFKKVSRISENDGRLNCWSFAVRAGRILGGSILAFASPRFRAESTCLGIALLIAAAIVMPWLSSKKRTLAAKTNSSALKADAVQSSMCAYLAWIALGGLLLNATFKFSWADLMARVCCFR
jgi:divalent metal cation (Fe/Co/Zn/Cd) transporter